MSCPPALDARAPAVGEEHLVGNEHSETARRRPHQPTPRSHDGVPGNRLEIREVGKERPPRDVLPERDPVDLLEDGDEGAGWGVRDDLVSEAGRADRLGDARDEGRVEPPGDAGELRRLRRAPERLVERDDVLGPEHEVDGGSYGRRLLERRGVD